MTTTTLLTRNDSPIDKTWVLAAHRSRLNIKLYEFNKLSNATAIKELKGTLKTLNHKYDEGDQAKNAILRASRHLNVSFPGAEGKLKRDYLMLKDARSLYFVGRFSTGKERLQISDNEAWIVEMFYDLLLTKGVHKQFPIYMYNTQLRNWCHLTMSDNIPKWIKIARPPKPQGNFIGIGGSIIDDDIKNEINLIVF